MVNCGSPPAVNMLVLISRAKQSNAQARAPLEVFSRIASSRLFLHSVIWPDAGRIRRNIGRGWLDGWRIAQN